MKMYCFFPLKKMLLCVIQAIKIYYTLRFFWLIVITFQKPPNTNNCLSASHTDADYQLCTELQRTHFNRFFTVCHRLPINPMLSRVHIEFRVMAKNQDVPLDRKTPLTLYQYWTDNLNFHSIIQVISKPTRPHTSMTRC